MPVRLRLTSRGRNAGEAPPQKRGRGGGASDAARSRAEPGNENHEHPMLFPQLWQR